MKPFRTRPITLCVSLRNQNHCRNNSSERRGNHRLNNESAVQPHLFWPERPSSVFLVQGLYTEFSGLPSGSLDCVPLHTHCLLTHATNGSCNIKMNVKQQLQYLFNLFPAANGVELPVTSRLLHKIWKLFAHRPGPAVSQGACVRACTCARA